VQSPSSFFFVTQVLKERLPYYAYPILEEIAKEEKNSAKRLKELFRIANHHNPANSIAIGSPSAACAMATAKPSADKHCFADKQPGRLASALLASHDCPIKEGNPLELLKSTLKETGEVGMLHMNYLASDAVIRNQDQVVTAGSTVYPRDLILGHVVDADFDATGVAKYAVLEPAADFGSLEQVFVLTEFETE
jgi:hypothetical protein